MKKFTIFTFIIILSISFITCSKNSSINSFSNVDKSNSIGTSDNVSKVSNDVNSTSSQLPTETQTSGSSLNSSPERFVEEKYRGTYIHVYNEITHWEMELRRASADYCSIQLYDGKWELISPPGSARAWTIGNELFLSDKDVNGGEPYQEGKFTDENTLTRSDGAVYKRQ